MFNIQELEEEQDTFKLGLQNFSTNLPEKSTKDLIENLATSKIIQALKEPQILGVSKPKLIELFQNLFLQLPLHSLAVFFQLFLRPSFSPKIRELENLLILIFLFRSAKILKVSKLFLSNISHWATGLHLVAFYDIFRIHEQSRSLLPDASQEFIQFLGKEELIMLLHFMHHNVTSTCTRQYLLFLHILEELFDVSFFKKQVKIENDIKAKRKNLELFFKETSFVLSHHQLVCDIYNLFPIIPICARDIQLTDLLFHRKLIVSDLFEPFFKASSNISDDDGMIILFSLAHRSPLTCMLVHSFIL